MELALMAKRSQAQRILIVDDDEDLRRNLEELFAAEGYEVSTAADASAALEVLAAGRFDLILTDLRMPGPSGVELIEEARRQNPDLRAILMTAFGDPHIEIESVRRGAVGYLTKPFEADEVINLVARILSLKED